MKMPSMAVKLPTKGASPDGPVGKAWRFGSSLSSRMSNNQSKDISITVRTRPGENAPAAAALRVEKVQLSISYDNGARCRPDGHRHVKTVASRNVKHRHVRAATVMSSRNCAVPFARFVTLSTRGCQRWLSKEPPESACTTLPPRVFRCHARKRNCLLIVGR